MKRLHSAAALAAAAAMMGPGLAVHADLGVRRRSQRPQLLDPEEFEREYQERKAERKRLADEAAKPFLEAAQSRRERRLAKRREIMKRNQT